MSSNKCKAAWSVINSAVGRSTQKNMADVSPDDYSIYFSAVVEDICENIEVSELSANLMLKKVLVLI